MAIDFILFMIVLYMLSHQVSQFQLKTYLNRVMGIHFSKTDQIELTTTTTKKPVYDMLRAFQNGRKL